MAARVWQCFKEYNDYLHLLIKYKLQCNWLRAMAKKKGNCPEAVGVTRINIYYVNNKQI